jgi:hypothetical protein
MLTCPMCKKTVPERSRTCPRCTTDLALLNDFVGSLQDGLTKAEALTREGRLGLAVWAYLEVLEVDPENPTARGQVGQVVTAVRQFDSAAPGRRWTERLRRNARFRQWLDTWNSQRQIRVAVAVFIGAVVLAGAFTLGYLYGRMP